MSTIVNNFIKEHFENLRLKPALFYAWDFGIRFEFALPGAAHEDPKNLTQIEERSTTIFKQVFQDSDELLLIMDIHCEKEDTFLQKRPIKVYQKYVKSTALLAKLQHTILPSQTWHEEDEGYEAMVTHRFVLPCQTKDIHYRQLLAAISHEDFPHPTRILKNLCRPGYDIFLVNKTRTMVYHLYDDRGCDVIASRKEDLRQLYKDCIEWILDYDREQIDLLFK